MEDVKAGKVRILLASPESIMSQHRQLISDLSARDLIAAVAVDEAHSVTKFGFPRVKQNGKKKAAFRPAYSRLIEVRAIIGDVPVIALTATATPEGQAKLLKSLSMTPCYTLFLPPHKANISYFVHRLPKDTSLSDNFKWLRDLIRNEGKEMKKVILFFHNVEKQALVNEYLDAELEDDGHVGEPPYGDHSHIFEMYHMKTDDSVKRSVLDLYSEPNGHMRCVLASSSFSMGLDISNITYVIHYGVPMDTDDFLQETGRAGTILLIPS